MNKLLALIVALFFGAITSGVLATYDRGSQDNGISAVDEKTPPQPKGPKGGDDDDDDDDNGKGKGGSKPKGKGHAE